MEWLQTLDVAGFRLINRDLVCPFFDWLFPLLSWNAFFIPALLVGAGLLAWKGGIRGRLFLLCLVLALAVGDGLLCGTLKQSINRPRPFLGLDEVRLLVGRGGSGSMPSSHAANWAAAGMVTFFFYRRWLLWMVPLVLGVCVSRIYVGVHYPSDVVIGLLLGAASGWAVVVGLDKLWSGPGRRWFPVWWTRLPSLRPDNWQSSATAGATSGPPNAGRQAERQWLRLGYILIVVVFVVKVAYLAAGKIELSEDEAYQWQWSRHLALSYFSKPPLIACAQFLGTSLFGQTAFGIRVLSPVIGAILSVCLLRFLAREADSRVAIALLVAVTATPLAAVGGTLMTIDSLSVLFWTTAMLSGWKAIKHDSTSAWCWTGLWLGLGFLSKYTALFQWLSFAILFVCWKPARVQLGRPGPWLALLINLACSIPVLLWNQQNGWITVRHLENRAGLDHAWQPNSRFFLDFIGAEIGLLNPVFFVAILIAAGAVLRRRCRNPLAIYMLAMGLPLFVFYTLYTVRARVQPNWIAPSVLPLLVVMILYWMEKWRSGWRMVRPILTAGFFIGIVPIILLHDTNLVAKIIGRPLPSGFDPLSRVRGWSNMAGVVSNQARILAAEGRPVFYIGAHYGITSLLSFYIPEAKAGVPDHPQCYFIASDHPLNQYYFWPGYASRKGENAIYAQRVDVAQPPHPRLLQDFESVTDLGIHNVEYRGRVLHKVQMFACRNLK